MSKTPAGASFTYPGLELVRDETGRSEAYFCRNKGSVSIDDALIASLKNRLKETGSGLIRVCLHAGPEATLHNMVIVQRRDITFKAHKHLAKEESYHMLEGKLRIDFFDAKGQATGSTVIGAPGTGLPMLCRVRNGVWHSTIPETEYAVIHESRPGPFSGADSVMADWDTKSRRPEAPR